MRESYCHNTFLINNRNYHEPNSAQPTMDIPLALLRSKYRLLLAQPAENYAKQRQNIFEYFKPWNLT